MGGDLQGVQVLDGRVQRAGVDEPAQRQQAADDQGDQRRISAPCSIFSRTGSSRTAVTAPLALINFPSIASAATVFFFRQYLEANLQISLVEAARIDGCGEFRTFNSIILPIMVPAMATMGIMAMIGSWNDIYRTEYGSIYLGLTIHRFAADHRVLWPSVSTSSPASPSWVV